MNQLYNIIKTAAEDKKASGISSYDVSSRSDLCNQHFICYGQNQRHTQTLAKTIETKIKEDLDNTKPYAIEGIQEGRWILLDYGDTIVHIMQESLKEVYRLEELWQH